MLLSSYIWRTIINTYLRSLHGPSSCEEWVCLRDELKPCRWHYLHPKEYISRKIWNNISLRQRRFEIQRIDNIIWNNTLCPIHNSSSLWIYWWIMMSGNHIMLQLPLLIIKTRHFYRCIDELRECATHLTVKIAE